MRKFLTQLFLGLFAWCSMTTQADASHLAGADLSYQCMGNGVYEVTLKIYRDCNGIMAQNMATIDINALSCGVNFTTQIPVVSVTDITPVCSNITTVCNDPNSPYVGYEEHVYVGQVTLPQNCPEIIMSYSLCCRNAAITNIQGPSAENLHTEVMLNTTLNSCNSSPQFANPPIFIICDSMQYNMSHATIEPDGDSLVYKLDTPRTHNGDPIVYVSGFDANNPFTTDGSPTTFDPTNGQLSFMPNGNQVGVFDVIVEEYRNGVLIGMTRRAIQLVVASCGNGGSSQMDLIEVFEEVNGNYVSRGLNTDFNICPGDPLNFAMLVRDINTNNSVALEATQSSILSQYPNATITPVYPNAPLTNELFLEVSIPAVQQGATTLGFGNGMCPIQNVQSYGVTILPNNCASISGQVILDADEDCIFDVGEQSLDGYTVMATNGNFTTYTMTDINGDYHFDLADGTYDVSVITPNILQSASCGNNIVVSIDVANNPNATVDFLIQEEDCALLQVDIMSNMRRRCVMNSTVVQYCNHGNIDIYDADVYVNFPQYVSLISADYPYTIDSNGVYVFDVDTVLAGQCYGINIIDSVHCESGITGLIQCTQAWITPPNSCHDSIVYPDTSGTWDRSSVMVEGDCQDSIVVFTIYNTGDPGNGDMDGVSEYRIYADGLLVYTGTFQINGGDSLVISVPANGQTIRLEADQRPGHPGNSHPNDVISNCGQSSNAVNWQTALAQPSDDIALTIEEHCLPIVDSYDPNDKQVSPAGIGQNYYVQPNTQLDYTIRFQNTGTADALKVVIVDTLSADLDISTIQWGVSSHAYTYSVSGTNNPILTFTFDNINLVPESVDELLSQGFVKFKINHNPNIPIGTEIHNSAAIYFDYNEPIITNDAWVTIHDMVLTGQPIDVTIIDATIDVIATADINNTYTIYPNPTATDATLDLGTMEEDVTIEIYTINGQLVRQNNYQNIEQIALGIDELPTGMYYIQIQADGNLSTLKVIRE